MTLARRIYRNTGFLIVSNIGTRIIVFILYIFIARFLGADDFGKFSFAMAYSTLFAILSNIGLNTLTLRDVARDKTQASRYFANVIFLEIFMSLLSFILICVIINQLDYPYYTKLLVYLIGITVILDNTFTTTCISIFRAFERMEYEVLITFIGKLLLLIGGILVLISGQGLLYLAYLYLFSSIITLILGFLILKKYFLSFQFIIDLKLLRYLIKTAIPFGLAGMFNIIYLKTDTIMLSFLKGDGEVGWYNAALNLVLVLALINSAFIYSIFPQMAKYAVSSKEYLKNMYEESIKISFIIIVPIGLGTVLLSEKIIILFYGREFINSIVALQILIWSGVISFLNGIFYTMFGAINKQKITGSIMGAGAFINVLLNLMLIPQFSYIGAAFSTIVTQAICFILSLFFLTKDFNVTIHKMLLKPFVASLVMGSFIIFFKNVNIIVLIFIGILLYFIFLYCIGGFSKIIKTF